MFEVFLVPKHSIWLENIETVRCNIVVKYLFTVKLLRGRANKLGTSDGK